MKCIMMKKVAWGGSRQVSARLFSSPADTGAQAKRVAFSLQRDGGRHGSLAASTGAYNSSGGSTSPGNKFLLSGATIATLLMLGGLHARRLYDDQKTEQARQQGIEPEFKPDVKAAFLQILPLRAISRVFGMLMSVELPVWARPYIYRSYCRAFHANLEEVPQDLESYASLQKFFGRSMKAGCRPLDPNRSSMISPVDGVMLRCGEIRGPGLTIEQVKGHSYSLRSLLGEEPHNLLLDFKNASGVSENPTKGSCLFYCVLYLGPGDYHRVHSPTDWQVLSRRHFSGRLFPVNERAARTIRNLYVGNERVVLQGIWEQGFMALVAVGATNVGSIQLNIEPDMKTNMPMPLFSNSGLTSVRNYRNEGSGFFIHRGDEMATFNLGSTIVLVFEASTMKGHQNGMKSEGFRFCVQQGQRIRMGQALGTW